MRRKPSVAHVRRASVVFAVVVGLTLAWVTSVVLAGRPFLPSARVVGTVRRCGGPSPGRCTLQHARVSMLSAGHGIVARGTTWRGHFAFRVRPGRYTVVAMTDGMRLRRLVRARARAVLTLSLVFDVK
jgi:hypothetical protein